MLGPYRNVLGLTGAPRLFLSALIARLPQGMASLTTLLLVKQSTRSYAAAGVAAGASALATAAGSPWLGRLIDRLGRRRVLVRSSLTYAVLLVALVAAAQLHAGAVALILLACAGGVFVPPIAPSVRALLRDAFPEGRPRESAYALESVAQELIWITGPLLVAVVVAISSPAAAMLVIAAESTLGTALFVRAPLARDRRENAATTRRGAALGNRTLRALLVPIALNGVALGSTEVGLPALALHAGSRSASGVLLALWSIGSMAGGLWYGARHWHAPLENRYALLLAMSVLCFAPLIWADSLASGLPLSLVAGLTVAPVFSCQYALVGRAVTAGTETEAFTWVVSALLGGIAIGAALGGVLVSAAGFSSAFALACGALTVAAGAAFVTASLKGSDGRPVPREHPRPLQAPAQLESAATGDRSRGPRVS